MQSQLAMDFSLKLRADLAQIEVLHVLSLLELDLIVFENLLQIKVFLIRFIIFCFSLVPVVDYVDFVDCIKDFSDDSLPVCAHESKLRQQSMLDAIVLQG